MNPYEPKATIVHREGQRVVDVYVRRITPGGMENLRLISSGLTEEPYFQWEEAPEGVEMVPFLSVPEDVYGAIRSVLVGDKLEEREFLRGRLQEIEDALRTERSRVDRLLP